MPICEADPWRMQYFKDVVCPPEVRIPTEDFDAYEWNPAHHWVYNKLLIAESQGIPCAAAVCLQTSKSMSATRAADTFG
jgi:hypothetical protein